ncbi:hypothetical protein NEOKW01_1368 [Nematocida sp. AWRm80]|nr:hypothetical protein NEOKW01_1368 [Nematocida sp. AWRm80]
MNNMPLACSFAIAWISLMVLRLNNAYVSDTYEYFSTKGASSALRIKKSTEMCLPSAPYYPAIRMPRLKAPKVDRVHRKWYPIDVPKYYPEKRIRRVAAKKYFMEEPMPQPRFIGVPLVRSPYNGSYLPIAKTGLVEYNHMGRMQDMPAERIVASRVVPRESTWAKPDFEYKCHLDPRCYKIYREPIVHRVRNFPSNVPNLMYLYNRGKKKYIILRQDNLLALESRKEHKPSIFIIHSSYIENIGEHTEITYVSRELYSKIIRGADKSILDTEPKIDVYHKVKKNSLVGVYPVSRQNNHFTITLPYYTNDNAVKLQINNYCITASKDDLLETKPCVDDYNGIPSDQNDNQLFVSCPISNPEICEGIDI